MWEKMINSQYGGTTSRWNLPDFIRQNNQKGEYLKPYQIVVDIRKRKGLQGGMPDLYNYIDKYILEI